MLGTQLKVWVSGLVLLALAVGGGALVAPLAQSQPPAVQPGDKLVVTSPLAADVVITQAYVCKLHSQYHIAIRPLVSGFLEEIPVNEGQVVKKGDVLFKIMPTSYQAKLDIEMAEVKIAQIEFDNVNKLFKNKVVSPEEVALSQAKLAKAQAKAKLAQAELSFTTVRAPFDGKIGRFELQPGSLAGVGDTLTTLTDNSVMRAYFNVPEVRYLEYMAGRTQDKEEPHLELRLASGGMIPAVSSIAAIEADSQNDTGTVIYRADFPNPDRLLLHGQTGNVLLHQTLHSAIVIPQRSTFVINAKVYVYVVGKDDVVQRREVSIRHEMDDYFVIQKGLDSTDRILVEGIGQVKVGEKVNAEYRKPEEVMPNLKKHVEK